MRYVTLDLMRGLAALAVLVFHMNYMLGTETHVIAKGYLAVDFFFILSGFVIAANYRITSYNVCYTKLLRFDSPRSAAQTEYRAASSASIRRVDRRGHNSSAPTTSASASAGNRNRSARHAIFSCAVLR